MKPIQKSEHQTSQFQEAINHVNVNVDVEENHTDASYVVQADPTTEDVAKASDQAVIDPMVEKVVGQATPLDFVTYAQTLWVIHKTLIYKVHLFRLPHPNIRYPWHGSKVMEAKYCK